MLMIGHRYMLIVQISCNSDSFETCVMVIQIFLSYMIRLSFSFVRNTHMDLLNENMFCYLIVNRKYFYGKVVKSLTNIRM